MNVARDAMPVGLAVGFAAGLPCGAWLLPPVVDWLSRGTVRVLLWPTTWAEFLAMSTCACLGAALLGSVGTFVGWFCSVMAGVFDTYRELANLRWRLPPEVWDPESSPAAGDDLASDGHGF